MQNMNDIGSVKMRIQHLYDTAPAVHIRVNLPRPKVTIAETEARIVGVYNHIFQVDEIRQGRTYRHTFQYGDVLIGHVIIDELNFTPKVRST